MGGSYKRCAWASDVWGGQSVLQNGGRHVDNTGKKWDYCNGGTVDDVEYKSAGNNFLQVTETS